MRYNMTILVFLFFTSYAYANPMQSIPCPSIQYIQQAAEKLDTVQKVEDKYLVYTAKIAFQESDLSWFITTAVHASSNDNALNKCKEHTECNKQGRYSYSDR